MAQHMLRPGGPAVPCGVCCALGYVFFYTALLTHFHLFHVFSSCTLLSRSIRLTNNKPQMKFHLFLASRSREGENNHDTSYHHRNVATSERRNVETLDCRSSMRRASPCRHRPAAGAGQHQQVSSGEADRQQLVSQSPVSQSSRFESSALRPTPTAARAFFDLSIISRSRMPN